MKVYVKLKDEKYNAYFTSIIEQNADDYGNGIYLGIYKYSKNNNANDNTFKYIDCRYMSNFNEKQVLFDVLSNYYGDNLVAIEEIKED